MQEMIIIAAAISLGFFVQTTIGFAAALTALPILLIALDLPDAVALLSIFFASFSLILVPKNWHNIDKKIFLKLGISSILGVYLGAQLLTTYGHLTILTKILGVLILLYIGYTHLKKKKIKAFQKGAPIFGFIGGIFSGLFSTGGPIFVAYINNNLKSAIHMRATIIGALGITNISRIPIFIEKDLLTLEIFKQALIIAPAFLLAIYLGHHFHKQIKEQTLKNLITVFLAISGVALILH
jgi:uncharacterized protein